MNVNAIIDAAVSHAMTLGIFSQVNTHEAKNVPPGATELGIWLDSVVPVPGRSGLAASSALVTLNCRIYGLMIQEPADEIDPRMAAAVDALINAYSGDFDLTSNVTAVDLLGAYGSPLAARTGYITIQQTPLRVTDVTLPLIVDDAWTQVE